MAGQIKILNSLVQTGVITLTQIYSEKEQVGQRGERGRQLTSSEMSEGTQGQYVTTQD